MGKRDLPRLAVFASLLAASPLIAACSAGNSNNEADVVAGKKLFVQKCGACHTLARAGTKGTQGPNLDDAFQRSLQEGFGRSAVQGVVHKQILYPAKGGVMPAKLVSGDQAVDVAAYVAKVAAKPGKDTGLLASAVPQAGGGGVAKAKNGVLSIPADPNGQLAYQFKQAEAPAGPITIEMPNKSGVPHDIAIDGLGKGEITPNGTSSFKATLAAGKTYTYFCTVPGHRAAGMQGTLKVTTG
jgi:mono/diheme cytochrome c family protein